MLSTSDNCMQGRQACWSVLWCAVRPDTTFTILLWTNVQRATRSGHPKYVHSRFPKRKHFLGFSLVRHRPTQGTEFLVVHNIMLYVYAGSAVLVTRASVVSAVLSHDSPIDAFCSFVLQSLGGHCNMIGRLAQVVLTTSVLTGETWTVTRRRRRRRRT